MIEIYFQFIFNAQQKDILRELYASGMTSAKEKKLVQSAVTRTKASREAVKVCNCAVSCESLVQFGLFLCVTSNGYGMLGSKTAGRSPRSWVKKKRMVCFAKNILAKVE